MNEDLILDRLANNIIHYTVQTRERVYNNVREEMMARIKELNFAVIEVALYLDTHNDDSSKEKTKNINYYS